MPDNKPIVEARGIHKHFGAHHVLKGVDLVLAERELVFVIGPSGSGKSTLLRCLNRLEEPSSGSVTVDGVDLLDPRTDINHARQRIGMVFQSFNLYPHMTALGNVTLALRKVAGKSRAEADALGQNEIDALQYMMGAEMLVDAARFDNGFVVRHPRRSVRVSRTSGDAVSGHSPACRARRNRA